MRLTTDAVANIKASEAIYRASDVAKAYGVNRSTVHRIWTGAGHSEVLPAYEPPDIETKARPSELADDIQLLAQRGWSAQQIADHLNIAVSSVYLWRGIF